MVLIVVLRALWRMLEPQRRIVFVGLVVLLLISGIFEMAGMMIIFGFIRGLSVDPATGERHGGLGKLFQLFANGPLSDVEFAVVGGGFVLTAMIVKNAQSMFVRYQLSRFLSNLDHRIALQLFGALAAMPYSLIIRSGGTGQQERLRGTLEVLGVCFSNAAHILADGAMLLMIMALLLFVDPALTALGAIIFGVLGVSIYRSLQRRLRGMGRADQAARRKIYAATTDAFGGLVEARLRDNVAYFQRRYSRAIGERVRVERRMGALGRIPAAANETVLALAIATGVLYMVLSGKNVSEALPLLGIFGLAGMRATRAMSRINRSFQVLRQRAERFERRLAEVSRLAPQVLGTSDIRVPSYLSEEKPLPEGRDGRFREVMSLERVSFKYPASTTFAVTNVSLQVKRGQFVSFCGESGSGKSTLVMLLMGLLRPQKGDVLCDDWSVFDHIRAWQKSIGYVGQTPYLSHATVRENVAFGVPDDEIKDAHVWAALDLAAARTFVEALPDGLNTVLAVAGSRLSGGQRQRIVIARALYHDPDIVVFDEATAALDNVTEQEITDATVRLSRDKTVICVAHRLTTIERSDVIHVLARGKIVDSGTYSELLERSEVFRRLARVS